MRGQAGTLVQPVRMNETGSPLPPHVRESGRSDWLTHTYVYPRHHTWQTPTNRPKSTTIIYSWQGWEEVKALFGGAAIKKTHSVSYWSFYQCSGGGGRGGRPR